MDVANDNIPSTAGVIFIQHIAVNQTRVKKIYQVYQILAYLSTCSQTNHYTLQESKLTVLQRTWK